MKLIRLISPFFLLGSASAEIGYSLNIDLASQYVSEGRTNTENPFLSTTIESTFQDVTLGFFQGVAIGENLQETNFSFHYGTDLAEGLAFSIGYTHLEFTNEDASDNEVDVSLAYSFGDLWEASVVLVYSDEAEGYFAEAAISKGIDLYKGLTITPYTLVAFDFGFVTEEFDGGNHIQVGFELAYELNASVQTYLALHRSFALEDIEREGLSGEFWANVGVTWEF